MSNAAIGLIVLGLLVFAVGMNAGRKDDKASKVRCPECGLLDKHKMDCSLNPDRPITLRAL